MALPTIFFIRHGQTDWNAEERFQGQRDIPLNDIGRSQAKRNGKVLRDWVSDRDFDYVSSPLERTRETMEIVRATLGFEKDDYRIDKRLIELSFGKWEGKTASELAVDNADSWQKRQSHKWAFVPPEGESYQMLSERLEGWLKELSRPTVVVAHGGVNRALRALLTGEFTDLMASSPTPQDEIMMVDDDVIRWL